MKTSDQYRRLIALPAAVAFALAACDRNEDSGPATSASKPTATASPSEREAPVGPGLTTAIAGDPAPASIEGGPSAGRDSSHGARSLESVTPAGTADEASAVTITPERLDFGQMQPGVPRTGIVTLTNNGDNAVQIRNAIPGCGCTTPTWPREPIGPGETAEIEITLKPSLKQGQRLNKRVTLQMMAGPPHSITVAGEVGIFVEMTPDFLDSAKQSEESQKSIVLTSVDDVPFSVIEADPPVLVTGIGGDKALDHEMEIDWAAWKEAGERRSIKLITDHPDAPELSVTVRRTMVREEPLPPPRMIRNIPTSKVVIAARARHVEGVAAAIEAGEDVDGVGQGGMTALHWAAKEGHAEIMAMLIEAGAEINPTNALGKTPVVMAAESGRLKELETLVLHGGRIDSVDEIGGTPLIWAAAMSKNPATVSYLIDQGADIDVVDESGMSPLIWAASIGQPASVQVLIEHGADVNLVEKHQQENALMRAARIGDPQCLEFLIAAEPDLEARNLNGQTALIIAAASAPPEKIRMLVDAGADLRSQDIRQWSVMDHAKARTDRNRAAVIAYLEEHLSREG